MDHFYKSLGGEEWFTYPLLCRQLVFTCPDNGKIVEVGCWKGKGSACFAVEIINSKKNIKLFCVDAWGEGIDQVGWYRHDPYFQSGKLFELFMSNMEPVKGYFTPIKSLSVEAAKKFEDNSLDAVFIDASHEYRDVLDDITSWLPKVKIGGILAGHDFHNFEGVDRALEKSGIDYGDGGEGCWIHTKKA